MKLTQQDITFIDTYLKNSEIEFIDVRMEMVDLVASHVEEKMETDGLSFYDAFKNYMVAHKKGLQKSHEKFKWTTDKKVFRKILYYFFKPYNLLLLPAFYLLLLQIQKLESGEQIIGFIPFLFFIMYLVVYYISCFRIKKLRFSSLERLGVYMLILAQIMNIFFNPVNSKFLFAGDIIWNFLAISLWVILGLSFLRALFFYCHFYKQRLPN